MASQDALRPGAAAALIAGATMLGLWWWRRGARS